MKYLNIFFKIKSLIGKYFYFPDKISKSEVFKEADSDSRFTNWMNRFFIPKFEKKILLMVLFGTVFFLISLGFSSLGVRNPFRILNDSYSGKFDSSWRIFALCFEFCVISILAIVTFFKVDKANRHSEKSFAGFEFNSWMTNSFIPKYENKIFALTYFSTSFLMFLIGLKSTGYSNKLLSFPIITFIDPKTFRVSNGWILAAIIFVFIMLFLLTLVIISKSKNEKIIDITHSPSLKTPVYTIKIHRKIYILFLLLIIMFSTALSNFIFDRNEIEDSYIYQLKQIGKDCKLKFAGIKTYSSVNYFEKNKFPFHSFRFNTFLILNGFASEHEKESVELKIKISTDHLRKIFVDTLILRADENITSVNIRGSKYLLEKIGKGLYRFSGGFSNNPIFCDAYFSTRRELPYELPKNIENTIKTLLDSKTYIKNDSFKTIRQILNRDIIESGKWHFKISLLDNFQHI